MAFFRDRQGYYHITFMVKIHRQQICQAINFSHFPESLSLKLSGIYDNLCTYSNPLKQCTLRENESVFFLWEKEKLNYKITS